MDRCARRTARPEDSSTTILVIDDDEYLRRALTYALRREGYSVRTAGNGAEGLHLLRQLRPVLVLLDVRMPDKDGYELCRDIRRDPELSDTYVILLTARARQEDRERGLLAGADECVIKPYSPRSLIERIRDVLDQVLSSHL